MGSDVFVGAHYFEDFLLGVLGREDGGFEQGEKVFVDSWVEEVLAFGE